MPVQQIELEEMIMDELSDLNDEALEGTVGYGVTNGGWASCYNPPC
jgi:hypothetical protein